MVSDNLIRIIIKAEDQASQQAEKVQNKLKKMGDSANQSNKQIAQSSQMSQQQINGLANKIHRALNLTDQIGKEGSNKFKQYDSSIQKTVITFNRLDSETQDMLRYLHQMSGTGRETFLSMSSKARDCVAKFNEMQNATRGWDNVLSITKTKMQLLGTDTDTVKGKVQVLGGAVKTYVGQKIEDLKQKWDGVKSKVTSLGGYIKSNLGSALSSIKSKVQSLGDAFSGLGGVISSVAGGIGMNSFQEMTIGASISRDRVKNLTYSLLDLNDVGNDTDALWKKMDDDTTKSLVPLDMLAQAMSVVKMSTGATKEEMAGLEPILLDVGQRAILMGKDSNEAMSLMSAVGKGLNGDFEMLRENLGITKEMLMNAGWDGTAQDVEGYSRAMQTCLEKSGDVSDMMNTTSGKIVTLQKNFRIAGRTIGDKFMPYLDQALDWLNKLSDPNTGSGLGQWAIGILGISSAAMTVMPAITPILQGFDLIGGKAKSLLQFFGLMTASEDALTISTLKNTIAQKANAIAKAAGGTAALTATGENAGLTASLWAMNTALLSNPITWVVVALIALAAAVYEVGKYFGWWKDIPGMLSAVWSGVNRLWNAFINHPDVQAFIQLLIKTWGELTKAVGWAWKEVLKFFDIQPGAEFDIISATIHTIGDAWNFLKGCVGNTISTFQWIWGILQKVWTGFNNVMKALGPFGNALLMMSGPVGMVVGILRQVVCILLGCSPGIVPALEKVAEAFTTVWNYIVSFISGIITNVVNAIQPVLDILTSIANFLIGVFQYAWQTVVMVFTIVMTHVNQIIMIFSQLMSGQITLSAALSMIWEQIKSMWFAVLTTITSRINSFAAFIITKALEMGRGFLNGIINYISSLPERVYHYLINVVSRISSAGASWVSRAVSIASSLVQSVINYISQLPGKVYTEFMNIGSKMLEAGSQLIEKAKNIGKGIVDGILNAMGIHSPGIIQTKVVQEFVDMIGGVEEQMEPAGEIAKQFGETIVNQFGDVSLEPTVGYTDLDAPEMDMNIGIDSASVEESNALVSNSYDQLANTTGASLQKMVSQDQLAYQNIRNNDSAQLSAITSNLNSKMTTMTNKVNTSLNTMVNKNKTGLDSARNTTKTQLTNITNQTVKANQKMVESWNTMKNGIVSAANKIRRDSESHFNKLSSTIGSFYGKLKNPSRWGAGPGNGRTSGITRRVGTSSSSGFKRMSQAVNKMTPQYVTIGQVQQNPLIDSKNFGDYILPGKNGMYDLTQILKYDGLTIPTGLGAGSWVNTAPAHVRIIKKTSRNWDVASPNIGRYNTHSANFKVREFETGTPRIDFNTFRKLAEDVYGQTKYEFYYDDDHHGNWLNAFNSGHMNCKHGAESIIAMANAMGLSGHMVHGHWNQFGHYWANIEGHKMDVTGWQNRKSWTPAESHAGPAPRKTPTFGDLIDEINKEPEVIVEDTSSTDGILVDGEVTVHHKHEFMNLPDTVSAKEVAELINDSTDDESWIRKLVQNAKFQKLDLHEKVKIERRTNRARGI